MPNISQDPRAAIGSIVHRVEFLAALLGEPLEIRSQRDIHERAKSLNEVLDGLVPGLSTHSPPSRPFMVHPDDLGYETIVDFGYLCLEQKVGEYTTTRTITINDDFKNAGIMNENSFSQARSTDLLSLIFVRLFPYWGYVENLISQDMSKMLRSVPPIFLNHLSARFHFK